MTLEQYDRVLVTGGLGIIGRHLVDALVEMGSRVVVLDKEEPATLPEGAALVQGDIRDPARLAIATQGVDLIFHLAATPVGPSRPRILG